MRLTSGLSRPPPESMSRDLRTMNTSKFFYSSFVIRHSSFLTLVKSLSPFS